MSIYARTTPLDRIIAKLKQRDSVFESERLKAWHHRANWVHRFANGTSVEIKLHQKQP